MRLFFGIFVSLFFALSVSAQEADDVIIGGCVLNLAPDQSVCHWSPGIQSPDIWFSVWIAELNTGRHMYNNVFASEDICTTVIVGGVGFSGCDVELQGFAPGYYGVWSCVVEDCQYFEQELVGQIGTPIAHAPNQFHATLSPTFEWTGAANATHYRLYIYAGDRQVVEYDQWYSQSDVCNSVGCAKTLSLPYAGWYEWWVQAYSPSGGYSEFSHLSFSIPIQFAPTLISPRQVLAEAPSLTFTWANDRGADWYYLYFRTPSGQNFSAVDRASTWCSGDTCNYQTGVIPEFGVYDWYLWAAEESTGIWSDYSHAAFSLAIEPPEQTTPFDNNPAEDNTPILSWNGEDGVEWYHVWINYEGQPFRQAWLEHSDENCSGGLCQYPILDALPLGHYEWWVSSYNRALGEVRDTDSFTFNIVALPNIESELLPSTGAATPLEIAPSEAAPEAESPPIESSETLP